MEKIDSFIFYRTWFEGLEDLPTKDRLKAYEAICELALNEVEIPLTGQASTAMKFMKAQILQNTKKYKGGSKGKEYGKLGGRPKKNKGGELEKNPLGVTEKTPLNNVNVNNNLNDNLNVNVNNNLNSIGFYEEEFGRPLSPTEMQLILELEKEHGKDLTCFALKEAIRNGVRTMRYIQGILNNWKSQGVKSVSDAEMVMSNHKGKQIVQTFKTEEISEEEAEELRKEMESWG